MSKKTYEEKRNYVIRLGLLLSTDSRTGIMSAVYKKDGDDEYVEINYHEGQVVAVRVTGDSCREIYKDIGRAVYGI